VIRNSTVLVQGQSIGSGGWHNFGKEDGRILYIIVEYWEEYYI
jgi:hypothetical protein